MKTAFLDIFLNIPWGLVACFFFAIWVYKDCTKRHEDGVRWSVPVILLGCLGLVFYLLGRPGIKQICPSCEHRISIKANYCENCGIPIDHIKNTDEPEASSHMKYLILGIFFTFINFLYIIYSIIQL